MISKYKDFYVVLIFNVFWFSSPLYSETENKLIHPEFHIDTNKPCPFECCSYGDWTVGASTPGYESPNIKSNVVGNFSEGNIATITKGEMHSYPGKYIIKKITRRNPRLFNLPGYGTDKYKSEKIKVGDTLYLFTYVGEGYYKIWYKGDFYVDSLQADGIEGEIILEPKSTWWVYAKSPLGWSGWADPYRFDNNNQCPSPHSWNVRVIYNTLNKKIRTPEEITTFNALIRKLDALDNANVSGNGYSLGSDDNGNMYIDLSAEDIISKSVVKNTNAVKMLADTAYKIASELGVGNKVMIQAKCSYCEEIILKY